MLALPEDVRRRYDHSGLRLAIHAAAPCPIPVKQKMIDWWGPKILEYYAGTEGGGTLIQSADWLTHQGSVGRHWSGGTVHILDENFQPILEPEVDGMVYFDAPEDPKARFRYHKDEAKTAESYHESRFTLGDIGHLDAEGFLYLTDRKSHMIISGGVNIYPQETENCLADHPAVEDVAVIGVPHEDMGEEVKAVVQLRPDFEASTALEEEMILWVRERIARYKAPRSISFVTDLPRQENGKIYKRLLRDQFESAKG
jgi:acyl-coenzyme A synthetase/AMP-(fatty) acid ligase